VELAAFERDAQFRGRLRHLLEQKAVSEQAIRLILSTHDFHGRPRDLLQKIEAMSNEPLCAVTKIAWHARSLRDNIEAFELLRARGKPMIALCMGQFGLMSRVLAGKFGGFLTFASDHATEVTAPGQPTIAELKQLFRFDQIKPTTKVYGVIGWPVEHSRSPQHHNAGFERIGFDGVYLPLPIPSEYEHFKATVGALIDGDALNFRGASVTIPHKENLVRFVR
jgi:3-dehydroquinate dehydratase/shikimate dehydrogenase